MRNFLAFLAAAVIVLAGVGWYLDWFKFSSTPSGEGRRAVTIDINTNKAGDDLQKGLKKLEEIGDKDKKADDNKDASKIEVKADDKNIELKTPKVDFSVPLRDFRFVDR